VNIDKDYSPEDILWLAVVEQTVWDAHEVARKDNVHTRRMLLRDIHTDWFDEVCQRAGLSSAYVIARITSIVEIRQ